MSTKKLLVIDDEPDICQYVEAVAESAGFEVRTTCNPDEFRALTESFAPHAIMLDLVMPQADGIELLRFLADACCKADILVASGMDPKVLQSAQRLGEERGLRMLEVLKKPVLPEELEAALARVEGGEDVLDAEELERAIEVGEIVAYYQPKLRLAADGSAVMVGAEALARWVHPSRGVVPPGEFIPLAEETGLIRAMTESILAQSVEQLARWDAAGLELGVAINLAAAVLEDEALPERLAALARRHGVRPGRITLEVTESAAMSDTVHSMENLTRFRLKGFGLSMDDYGTGFSSLVQLYRMPFNELKVDRSFVRDVGGNREAEVIVRSIVELGHNLGLSVCAEGVETREALEFLAGTNCEMAQGFLMSKPVPADDLPGVVRAWNAKESDAAAAPGRPAVPGAVAPLHAPHAI